MIVADAIAAIGSPYADADAGDLVIVQFRDGRPVHRTLDTASNLSLTTDTYLATGAFRAGSITTAGGRSLDNLTAILSLPFDIDLSDYSGYDKTTLHQMPDDDLDALINDLVAYSGNAFRAVGIVPNRVDVTGYGIALHVNVAHADQRSVAALRDAHRRIGQQINRQAGFSLVDEQALDAGTRIMRLPPSPNTKRADRPRMARTLHNDEGAHTLDALQTVVAAFGDAPEPVRRIVPNHGRELSPDAEARVIDSVAAAWSEGQRHAIALGLAGWLAKSGVPQAQAQRIIGLLASGDGDDRRDRERAVETTYRNVESGNDAAGYTSLRQRLPQTVLTAVGDVLDAYRQATAPTITLGSGRIATPPVAAVAPMPDVAYYGAIGEYVDLASPTTEAPDQFHAASFLAMVAAQAGRRFYNEYGDPLYPNVFVLIVGTTGSSRKDTAMRRARSVPDLPWSDGVSLRSLPWSDLTDVSSAEGLIVQLAEHPSRLLFLSELTAMMTKARRKGSESILDVMIMSYDCRDRIENNSKVNSVVAKLPYLVGLAATQPERLGKAFDDEVVGSGFANRWLIVPGCGKSPIPRPPQIDRRRAAALWRRVSERIESLAPIPDSDGYYRPVVVDLDDDCIERWDDYYNREFAACNVVGIDPTLKAMRQRRPENVRKVAMLFALTDGLTTIHDRHLQPAIALVDWSWSETVKLVDEWNPSVEARIERRIVDVLQQFGALKNAELQQKTGNRAWSATEYNRVVKAMVEVGSLVRDGNNVIALGNAR